MQGVLFIDKPEKITSAKVDRIIKKIIKPKKIGHIGTLDPFATGMLPVAINGATKLIQYFKWTKTKTYIFEIQFGIKTNTGDCTGEIVKTSSNIPDINQIQNILPKFIGNIQQKPHAFSAVKINGQNAYNFARKGIQVDIKPKTVNVNSLKLITQIENNVLKFEATVSSGTYIRSLTEDIATALNSLGYTKSLRRISIGKYNKMITLDQLEENLDNLNEVIVSAENLLDDIPVVLISDDIAHNLRLGKGIICQDTLHQDILCRDIMCRDTKYLDTRYLLVKSPSGFIELVTIVGNYLQPKKLIEDFKE